MMNRQKILRAMTVAALLCVPALAAAQGGYYSRNQYPSGRYDDSYRYDRRSLRDAISRVKNRSRDFERSLDHSLDRSRFDGTRREDRINDEAKNFRNAAEDLKDRVGDAKNLDRSAGQARRLAEIGDRIDRFAGRNILDGRAMNYWAQIRQDLRLISDAYGFRGGYGGRWR
jgi:hypothetical protein